MSARTSGRCPEPSSGHVSPGYAAVGKVNGDVGRERTGDLPGWGHTGEGTMAARVAQAREQLGSAGRSLVRA